ncbi:GNAT family acetyltransferase [Kaistella solincola]|uniref:GNAT family acetyltransferase n=1 Tax=Kaistella solincola TaxID=510955 RepID=A0ABR4ZQ75_9FLAO|nr:GNAT family N-acetyltransferase [Kaistella solincola]KIA83252.1 GNAT family acetyltransferase [Kaistella solincola]
MPQITLKKVTLENLTKLQEISRQTFEETFAQQNSAEDMQKYLAEALSTSRLTKELLEENSEFYFALGGTKITGYIKLNSGNSQTELQHENSLEIERIYVLKEFLGKKVGQILFNHALQIAKEKKVDFVWLGVWEKNERAINFYLKNGFEKFGQHSFFLGTDEQTDIMMKLKITHDS